MIIWVGHREIFPTRGRDNLGAKGARGEASKNAPRPKEAIVCFWCRQEGHHQADCTNSPFFFRCKESGHLVVKCPKSMSCSMRMLGFGFLGMDFHCLKIPELTRQPKAPEHRGLIGVKSGEANAESVTPQDLISVISANGRVSRVKPADTSQT
jgi:hypothetical protein